MKADLTLTTHARHATELAARALADGFELIVAVGGDGTLNEVAASLVGTPATFGLVPCGSGNALGRHLGIHGSVARSLGILATGQPRLVDTGYANEHPFFTVAGLGFEADVSASFNRLKNRGFLRYLTTSSQLWWGHRSQDCIIEHEHGRMAVKFFTLAVANTDQYGNQAFIAPAARVDDGLLDLVAIPPVSAWRALPLLTRLFTGSLHRGEGVLRLQGSRFVIERTSPGALHTDGETQLVGKRIEFTIRPLSLRVLVPAPAAVR